jgi:hypothetical protein
MSHLNNPDTRTVLVPKYWLVDRQPAQARYTSLSDSTSPVQLPITSTVISGDRSAFPQCGMRTVLSEEMLYENIKLMVVSVRRGVL